MIIVITSPGEGAFCRQLSGMSWDAAAVREFDTILPMDSSACVLAGDEVTP